MDVNQQNQFEMLASAMAGNNTAQSKSKTVDYKVLISNKNGEVRNVGYLNVWNRFSETQIASLTNKVSGKTLVDLSDEIIKTQGSTVAELKATISSLQNLIQHNSNTISIELATSETTAPDDEF